VSHGQTFASPRTYEHVAAELSRLLGTLVTVEYPGWLFAAHATDDARFWEIGTANGSWGANLVDNDGTIHATVEVPGSADALDATQIAAALAEALYPNGVPHR
jgi:hypothetical protein